MEAVILAGGFGTRLRPLTNTRPKPLLPILGRAMIDHVVLSMPDEVDRVVLAVNYMADAIRDHLGRTDLGVEVTVVEEDEPLGTGGAFRNALGGGGSTSLRLDAQGKTYAQALLRMPLDLPEEMEEEVKDYWGDRLPGDCIE